MYYFLNVVEGVEIQIPLGTWSLFGRASASRRMHESTTNPSQPARTNMKSLLVSHTPRTLVTILPLCVLHLGRLFCNTFTLIYIPSNFLRQFCKVKQININYRDVALRDIQMIYTTSTSKYFYRGSVHVFIIGCGFFINSPKGRGWNVSKQSHWIKQIPST